jgi:hypothetical protein
VILDCGDSSPLLDMECCDLSQLWDFGVERSITGEDPVPPADRDNLSQMTAAWLRWASEHGY